MRLSPARTEAMLIHPSYGARRSTAKFTLQGTPIPWKRRVTYLGVQLDHRLRWSPAVKAQLKNARRAISAARALLARGNGCTPSLALRLFQWPGGGPHPLRPPHSPPCLARTGNRWTPCIALQFGSSIAFPAPLKLAPHSQRQATCLCH
ncbi:hypothetical protein MTO96_038013 [Rhipicephalus appendiculatus]